MPHTSHEDLNAYPPLTCPSLCQVAQTRCGNRQGHNLSYLQVILCNATDTGGMRIPEDCTHTGAGDEALLRDPPAKPGMRCTLCHETGETAGASGQNICPAWGCLHGKQGR